MAFVLFDGTSAVSMEPEYDLRYGRQKIENVHRTRSGAQYRYTWGRFNKVKFSVENLSSADMTQVNSWWAATTPLRLFDANSTVVISGYLTNASQPIDQYIKPYTDLFMGTIELEGY